LDPADVVGRLARKGHHDGPTVDAYFTATATDVTAGATSEFSQALKVALPAGKGR